MLSKAYLNWAMTNVFAVIPVASGDHPLDDDLRFKDSEQQMGNRMPRRRGRGRSPKPSTGLVKHFPSLPMPLLCNARICTMITTSGSAFIAASSTAAGPTRASRMMPMYVTSERSPTFPRTTCIRKPKPRVCLTRTHWPALSRRPRRPRF